MAKTLLPFALYEELEKIESLDPSEMKNFLSSLQKYCESTGKDFTKVCTDIGLEAPSWAGKLTHPQNTLINQCISTDYNNREEGSSWSINPETGRLDVIGKFRIPSYSKENWGKLVEMGIKIGRVKGSFDVSDCGLSSSEGFPLEVTGDFNINNNRFDNLIGGPVKVGGRYQCSKNKLTSLEGAPESANEFDCSGNPGLKNLNGGPKEVTSRYDANDCNLNSLEGFATKIDPSSMSVYVSSNNLYTLEGLPLNTPLTAYRISCSKNPLKGEVLLNAYKEAARTGSWIVGYLSMFTDPEFIKTGKAPKDPIREKLAPANLKKEIETNGSAFVVGLKSIWKDFRVQKILKGIEIPSDTKADAEMLADLDGVGL